MLDPNPSIIFFDGVCGLCNGFVDWLIARDKKGFYRFAALQGVTASSLLKREYTQDLKTIILYRTHRSYFKSGAVLRAVAGLGGFWKLVLLFLILPHFIRNKVYEWVAANRYQWFGKKDQCRIPTPEERKRFLD